MNHFVKSRGKYFKPTGRHGTPCHHLFPFKHFVRPWILGSEFMSKTVTGVYQYVFIRTFFAVLVVFAEPLGMYGEGDFDDFKKVYVYQMIVVNLSQTWALYCLLLFYHETLEGLRPLAPFGKFVSVKCVIFLSFWQSVLISILAYAGYIKETHDYNLEDVTKGLQDFLICVEMGIAAIAFRYTFSQRDFQEDGALLKSMSSSKLQQKKNLREVVLEVLPNDVVSDVHNKVADFKTLHRLGGSKRTDMRIDNQGQFPFNLVVHVVRAVNLKDMDSNGLSDPFLKVHVGNTRKILSFDTCERRLKCCTRVIRKTLNPEWNETFEIPLTRDEASNKDLAIQISVWDWDLVGTNDLIGETVVPLSEIQRFLYYPNAINNAQSAETQAKPTLRREKDMDVVVYPDGVQRLKNLGTEDWYKLHAHYAHSTPFKYKVGMASGRGGGEGELEVEAAAGAEASGGVDEGVGEEEGQDAVDVGEVKIGFAIVRV